VLLGQLQLWYTVLLHVVPVVPQAGVPSICVSLWLAEGYVQHAPNLFSLILKEVIPVNQRQVRLALLSIGLMILAMDAIVELVPGFFKFVQVLVPYFLIFLIIIKHLCFSLELIGLIERA
jgi:hypothetical protein